MVGQNVLRITVESLYASGHRAESSCEVSVPSDQYEFPADRMASACGVAIAGHIHDPIAFLAAVINRGLTCHESVGLRRSLVEAASNLDSIRFSPPKEVVRVEVDPAVGHVE